MEHKGSCVSIYSIAILYEVTEKNGLDKVMRRSRQFCQRRSVFENVFLLFLLLFLVDEGRKDPNTTISGPLSAI